MNWLSVNVAQSELNPAREAEWIIAAIVLTAGEVLFALVLIPNYSGIVPALMLLPMWMVSAAAVGAIVVLIGTIRMMAQGMDRPISRWYSAISERRWLLVFVAVAMLLAGLNMIAFMWVKPLLNHLVPFWSDPYLAAIDRQIFRTDPWRLLGWLNSDFMALFYHRGWFVLMILMLLKVLSSPSSREKNAIMLTYFALWSLFGPIVHVIAPAAGPVFYERLGYGLEFAAMPQPPQTRGVADYLWHLYIDGKFGPASGISAMPSLHIATTVWVVVAAWLFARTWIVPVSAAALLIFLLSISLGWHYAIDGLVGGAGALLLYLFIYTLLRPRWSRKREQSASAGLAQSSGSLGG